AVEWDGVGRTADGHLVPLLANVGDADGAAAAAERRAQGVGLFRTELPFLSLEGEPNPALGVRGLRIARVPGNGADVLERQLAGLAAAAKETGAELKVMAPMVATAEEARFFVQRCRAHGITSAGVMIEIPAAVLVAREIMAEVDFVSVGTNDLAQY